MWPISPEGGGGPLKKNFCGFPMKSYFKFPKENIAFKSIFFKILNFRRLKMKIKYTLLSISFKIPLKRFYKEKSDERTTSFLENL